MKATIVYGIWKSTLEIASWRGGSDKEDPLSSDGCYYKDVRRESWLSSFIILLVPAVPITRNWWRRIRSMANPSSGSRIRGMKGCRVSLADGSHPSKHDMKIRLPSGLTRCLAPCFQVKNRDTYTNPLWVSMEHHRIMLMQSTMEICLTTRTLSGAVRIS